MIGPARHRGIRRSVRLTFAAAVMLPLHAVLGQDTTAGRSLQLLRERRRAPELPTWTDRRGRRIQAELLLIDDRGRYVFRTTSGKELRVHYKTLSAQDHIRASKQLLQAGADAYVRSLIGKGTLISAKRRGVVVQGGTAVVGYEFTFRTKAGLVRTNPNGHLYFYLDEAKGWINSDVVIDGLPRY